MILPLVTTLILASGQAYAGGIGLIGAGGLHQDRVYSYQMDAESGDISQAPVDVQYNPSFGGGIELMLGDRDNKVLGVVRGYYYGDAPQSVPAGDTGVGNSARQSLRHVAMVTGGMQYTLVGDPQAFQLVLIGSLGTSFLELDPSEEVDLRPYAVAEAGPGITLFLTDSIQLAASTGFGVRYSKRPYFTGTGYVGLRYLFD